MDLVKLLNDPEQLAEALDDAKADPAFVRAVRYAKGLGVPQDAEVAKVLLSKDPERPEVQYLLGVLAGDDLVEAEKYFLKASELGAEKFVRPALENLYEETEGIGRRYLDLCNELKQLKATLSQLSK
jgi:TPR repeat protein